MLRVEGSARCGGVPQGAELAKDKGGGYAAAPVAVGGSKAAKHHPSADGRRGGRHPCYGAPRTIGTRARRFGLHLAVFCEPHFTWAAAAETLPQHRKRRTRGVKMGCAPSQQQKPPSPQKRDFQSNGRERSGRKFCEVYELLKDLIRVFGTVACAAGRRTATEVLRGRRREITSSASRAKASSR